MPDLDGIDTPELGPGEPKEAAAPPSIGAVPGLTSARQNGLRSIDPPRTSRLSGRALLIGGIGLVLLACVGIIAAILWPTWEDKHGKEILALLQSADTARAQKQVRSAYDQYAHALDLANGQTIHAPLLKLGLDDARTARDALYPIVRADIEREQREQAARAAAAEQQRVAREAAERDAARQAQIQAAAQKEAERQRAAAEAARASRALRLAAVRNSAAFRSLISQAQSIHAGLTGTLITEDSAYRAVSEASGATVALMGLYVREEAMLDGTAVDGNVDSVQQSLNTAIIGEDSVYRAIYKKEQAFVDMLGVFAEVLDRRSNGGRDVVARLVEAKKAEADAATRLDDSAPRAMAAYNDASTGALGVLSNAMQIDANATLRDALSDNAGENSVWRVADRDAEAQATILLAWLRTTQPTRAAAIQRDMQTAAIGEESAVRSLFHNKKAVADTLLALIQRN